MNNINPLFLEEGWRDWWNSIRDFNTRATNAYSKGADETYMNDNSYGPSKLKTLRNLNKTYSFLGGLKNFATSGGSFSDRLMAAKDAQDRGSFRDWGITQGSNILNAIKRYGRAFKLKKLRNLKQKGEISDRAYMGLQKKARGENRVKQKYVWTPKKITTAITTT